MTNTFRINRDCRCANPRRILRHQSRKETLMERLFYLQPSSSYATRMIMSRVSCLIEPRLCHVCVLHLDGEGSRVQGHRQARGSSSRGALSRQVAIDDRAFTGHHSGNSQRKTRIRNTRRQSIVSLSALSGKQVGRIKSSDDLSRSTRCERVPTLFTCGNVD